MWGGEELWAAQPLASPGLSKTASDEARKNLGVSLLPKQESQHFLKRNPCTLTFHPEPSMGMRR